MERQYSEYCKKLIGFGLGRCSCYPGARLCVLDKGAEYCSDFEPNKRYFKDFNIKKK